MPIYEYRCEKGHTFEVTQRMSEDPITNCTTCNASVQRVFHPVAVHFKGSGFYTTDYGKKKRSGSSGNSSGESSGESKSSESKSESKSDSKSSSDSSSSSSSSSD
jgi:putative FmdB family regulatory protein